MKRYKKGGKKQKEAKNGGKKLSLSLFSPNSLSFSLSLSPTPPPTSLFSLIYQNGHHPM
jgi:hypothetical protein